MLLPAVVVMLVIAMSSSPFLEKNVGMFLTISRVSHFVLWRPYSKSVSIRFSGWLTRILLTGSTNVSEGSKTWKSDSTKICSLSVLDMLEQL